MNLDIRYAGACVLLFVLAGCAADTETPPDESTVAPTDENTSESAEELRRGSKTYGYVAVGKFAHFYSDGSEAHCTATLVGHRSVLTAAHCVDFKNKSIGQTGDAQFTVELSATRSTAYNVDAWHVFGTHAGADDLALLHLSARASASIPIAQLRRAEPHTGDLARMLGYGIHDCPLWDATSGHDDGAKRIYSYHWGTPPHALCAGDSGGPTFVSGEIAQVASQVKEGGFFFPDAEAEQFGHVWKHYKDIQFIIDVWD